MNENNIRTFTKSHYLNANSGRLQTIFKKESLLKRFHLQVVNVISVQKKSNRYAEFRSPDKTAVPAGVAERRGPRRNESVPAVLFLRPTDSLSGGLS